MKDERANGQHLWRDQRAENDWARMSRPKVETGTVCRIAESSAKATRYASCSRYTATPHPNETTASRDQRTGLARSLALLLSQPKQSLWVGWVPSGRIVDSARLHLGG